MCKMVTLELERVVVATNDALENALVAAVSRILQFAHHLLQIVVGSGETFQDGFCVARATGNVVV